MTELQSSDAILNDLFSSIENNCAKRLSKSKENETDDEESDSDESEEEKVPKVI